MSAAGHGAAPLTPRDLLELLYSRGLSLHRRDDQLVLRGPTSKRTPAIVEACRSMKAELLALLTPGVTHPCTRCGRFAFSRADVV